MYCLCRAVEAEKPRIRSKAHRTHVGNEAGEDGYREYVGQKLSVGMGLLEALSDDVVRPAGKIRPMQNT